MLSNVAAGTVDHIWSIFEAEAMNGLVRSVIQLSSVRNKESYNVRKEAMYAVCNLVTTASNEQYKQLLQLEVLDPICDMLSSASYHHDVKLLLVVLEAVEFVLHTNELNGTSYDQIIDGYGGVEALEDLQEHSSHDVYLKAASILEKYFNGVAEQEIESYMVSTSNQCDDTDIKLQHHDNSMIMMNPGPIKFDFSSPNTSSDIMINNVLPPKQLFPITDK
jgi:Atypical Arm repeat